MSEEAVVFGCEGDALVGVLHHVQSANATDVGVLVIVGGPQYRVGSHRQFVIMARTLAASGFPVLRFDVRGMGDSDGDPRTFEAISTDVRAAIDAFIARMPSLRGVVLWGLCDAASAALMYCTSDRRVLGLVLANPWVRTEASEARSYLKHYYLQRLFQRSFWSKVVSGKFSPVTAGRQLLGAVSAARGNRSGAGAAGDGAFIDRMRAGIQSFGGPVLFLISKRDLTAKAFVDLANGERSWRRAMRRPHVSVIHLPGADHTFASRSALEAASNHCVEWLRGERLCH